MADLPPSVFAAAFSRHVVPRLRAVIAARLKAGDDFPTTMKAAVAAAHDGGAGHLPGPHYDALLDWIGGTILDEQAKTFEAEDLIAGLLREPSRARMRERIAAYLHG